MKTQRQGQVTTLIGDTFVPLHDLPNFDLHRVEQALRVNHVLYNGTPLTETELRSGIQGYREFLARHRIAGMPDQFEVPSYLVDRVWHAHMCETKDYGRDMIAYFGTMFHHGSAICNGGGVEIRPMRMAS